MFSNLDGCISTYWGLILILAVVILSIVRLIIYIKTGKIKQGKLDQWWNESKDSFFEIMGSFMPVVNAEQSGGRIAAKKKIKEEIIKFISESQLLTENEKSFMMSMNIDYLIDEIEKELISLKVLEP